MLYSIRLIFALFLVIIIVPQTRKENLLLEKFHESGFFITYGEAKWFLNFFTWFSIILFLCLATF